MLDFYRNLLLPAAALVAAVVLTGLAQGAFDFMLPSVSARSLGNTNVSTYAMLVPLGALFFLVGAYLPRWLRTPVPLLWMLLPVAAVYLAAVVGQPYVYRCNPFGTLAATCSVIVSPFVVGALATIAGYRLRGRRSARR